MLFPSLALLSSVAHAWIFVGNPEGNFKIELPGTQLSYAGATVDYVRVHKCGGGYDQFEVDKTVDLVNGFTVAINPGDLCGVSVKWTGDVEFGGSNWDVTYSEPYTSVTLDGSPSTVWQGLTPFTVTNGDIPSGGPRLVVTVQ